MNTEMTDSSILVVFCRRPVAGIGKQRIAVDLGEADTMLLAEQLLATALEDAESWPGEVVLAPADPADAAWAAQQLQRPSRVIAQGEGNLGERINRIDRSIRARGGRRLVFIGSDAPGLDEDYFALARSMLLSHDVVLGPAEDGGVTLMAAGKPWPDLGPLPWSSDNLGASLEHLCRKNGLSLYRMRTRCDIDFYANLPELYGSLQNDGRQARRRLRAWLETMDLRDRRGGRHE